MNNEIKEILVKLKEHLRYQKEVADVDSNVAYLRLTIGQYKLLLDYITNLQQENEKLKDIVEHKPIFDFTTDVYEELEDYKSRCEKAVEYIKEHIRIDDEYPDYMKMLIEEKDKLLNILNGRSDKEML